jgi:hypothetical protein
MTVSEMPTYIRCDTTLICDSALTSKTHPQDRDFNINTIEALRALYAEHENKDVTINLLFEADGRMCSMCR